MRHILDLHTHSLARFVYYPVIHLQPDTKEEGYDDMWKERIVTENDNGDRYRIPASASSSVADIAKRRVIAGKRK